MRIYDLTGEQMLALSWIVASNSVQGLSLAEQDVLGCFFVSLGENILLIRSQNELLSDIRSESNGDTENQFEAF